MRRAQSGEYLSGRESFAQPPALLLHDFRRSAWRPAKDGAGNSGHKTGAVFSRYNIVSEADIRDAAGKIEQGAKAVILEFIHSCTRTGQR